MAILLPFMLLLTQLLFPPISSSATDTITQPQNLTDGNTLVSNNEIYELGFFRPGISSNCYLGIWYHKIPVKTYVWVANRDNPIKDNSSMLSITSEGKLVLLSQNKTVVWSANSTSKPSNPIVQLLDSGNLILRGQASEDPQSYSWQSFDYPSDTLLAGMKLGWDGKTGLDRRLTSWKNWDDPSTGDFTTGILRNSYPELVIWKGDTEYSRTGPWNGNNFVGIPVQQRLNELFEFEFVSNKDEVYYKYELKIKSMISRWVLNQTHGEGTRQRTRWIEKEQTWKFYTSVPTDYCEKSYNNCGPYSYCVVGESPICQCLDRFKMKSQEESDDMNWTQGCVRNESWSCGEKNKDGFLPFSGLLLPDTKKTWVDASMTLDDCKAKCLQNCSCTAYANSNINGSGCVLWFGDLIDLKNITSPVQDLYIRMAVPVQEEAEHWKRKAIVVAVTVPSALLILFSFSYIYITRRKFRETEDESRQEDMEDLPFFDFATIANATNGFANKLGEGGFGPVYKGTLAGQEIAVKRLSRSSIQGTKEFKNEVILCSKLQHRNLVKILGCCIRGEEKMLIYEYMSNRSLDYFLFDSTKSKLLDWSKRFDILCGIARGLLYLHQDSRLRIIHRDLKTSNILLDGDLNPKISDFGLAKMFGRDQVEGNTSKVVGTHGYMAPEYAIDGEFSTKIDVFTFGILLLEIVSGRKNRMVYSSNQKLNLISHAWKLWKEGNVFELIDDCLRDSVTVSEVLRCIHIGLLCLQHHPEDRPSMASVVLMLSSSTAILSEPKEPGFLLEKVSSSSVLEGESSSSMRLFSSINEMSVTEVSSR